MAWAMPSCMPMPSIFSICSTSTNRVTAVILVPPSCGSKVTYPGIGCHARHRLAVVAGETVCELESPRLVDRFDPPPTVRRVAAGTRHEVARLAADHEIVARERRWVRRRAPPALELARILPELPDLLRRGRKVGHHRERQVLCVLLTC